MRLLRSATYLWPGLPQLWFRGAWSGLALALGFAMLVDLLLLASLVWVEMLEPGVLRFGWLALGVVWVGSVLVLSRSGGVSNTLQKQPEGQEDLYRQALGEYLKGNWFEAESLLVQTIAADPRDVDARLMFATILRHTKRYPEARRQLAELDRLARAEKWRFEIEQEKQLLTEAEEDIANPLRMIMANASRAA